MMKIFLLSQFPAIVISIGSHHKNIQALFLYYYNVDFQTVKDSVILIVGIQTGVSVISCNADVFPLVTRALVKKHHLENCFNFVTFFLKIFFPFFSG